MPTRETETVLSATDCEDWQRDCEEAGGIYLGLDDLGRRVYRVPADALKLGFDEGEAT